MHTTKTVSNEISAIQLQGIHYLNERSIFFARVVVKVVEYFSRHEQQKAADQVSVTGERSLGEGDISKSGIKSLGPIHSSILCSPLLASSVVCSLAGSQGHSTGQEQNCGLHIFSPLSLLRVYGTASRPEKVARFILFCIFCKKKTLAIAVTQFGCD